ncbi:MAG: hypothetical protein E5W56_20505, partial [Mesorhizobium sp.]
MAGRGPGESDGSDASKESTTQGGTFTIHSPDGIASLNIGGHDFINDGAFTAGSFTTALGNTLTVTFNVSRPKPDGSTYRDLITFHAVWDSSLILFKYYDWGKVALDLETDVIPNLAPLPAADQTPEKWLAACH